MKAISQLVVRVFDLIEAEGATLRTVFRGESQLAYQAAARMALGLAFLFISVPLCVAGVGLMSAGLMWWLELQVGRPLAACVTGVVILGIGGACLCGFKVLTERRRA